MLPETHREPRIWKSFATHFSRINGVRLVGTLITVLISIFAGWLTTYISLSVKDFVDELQIAPVNELIYDFSIILLGVVLLRETVTIVRKIISEKIATSIEKDEYRSISGHLMSLDQMGQKTQKFGRLSFDIDKSIEGLVKLFKVIFYRAFQFFP